MPRISFNLSSEKLNTGGGPDGLNAPMLRGGGEQNIQAPQVRPAMQEAATSPVPKGNVPLLEPDAVQKGFANVAQAAIRYQDRTDDLYAEDAHLRYNLAAQDILRKVPQQGEEVAPGFLNLKGKDAMDARMSYEEKLKGLHEEIANSLGGNARSKYLAKSLETRNSHLTKIAEHTVKQQEWFNGQVIYGNGQVLKKEINDNPVDVVASGKITRYLSLIPGKEEREKAEIDILSFLVDDRVAKDPIKGPEQAAALFNSYSKNIFSYESGITAMKKIRTAEEAGRKIAEREQKDVIDIQRLTLTPQITQSLANNLNEGNGIIFLETLSKLDGLRPPGEKEKVQKDKEEAVRNALRANYTQAKKAPELIESQFERMARQGEANGKPLDPVLYNVGLDEIRDIMRDRDSRVEMGQKAATAKLTSALVFDPKTGTVSTQATPQQILASGASPSTIEHHLNIAAGSIKERAKGITDAQYNQRNLYWRGLARKGELRPDSPKYDEFLTAMQDPSKMLTAGDAEQVQMIATAKEKEPSDKNYEEREVRKLIEQNAVRGLYSRKLENKEGAKAYKPLELDEESTIAVGRENDALDDWMRRNPKGSAYQWYKERTAQLQESIVPSENWWGKEQKLTKQPTGEGSTGGTSAPATEKWTAEKAKAKAAEPAKVADYGLREDGTPKGKGWLGEIKTTYGNKEPMTELSIGVNIGGKEMLIPSLVPTLSKDEIAHLANGGKVTPEIEKKAAQHAIKQLKEGKGVWADNNIPPPVQAILDSPKYARLRGEYDAGTPERKAAILKNIEKQLQGGK